MRHSGYTYTTGGDIDFILLSTGASERNKNKNIYDLAGNMNEFTLEHSTIISALSCTIRDGGFTKNKYIWRYLLDAHILQKFHLMAVGFRVTIY